MSYSNQFQGPFVKKVYSSLYNTGRAADNPAFGAGFNDTIPTPLRRIHLVLQNNSGSDALITWGDVGNVALTLHHKQSITFDNFNAGFSSDHNISVFEAFA